MKRVATLLTCAALLVAPMPAHAADVPTDPLLAKVFTKVNKARSKGRDCGDRRRSPVPPLHYSPDLSVASQRHAEDMATNDYFDHLSLDGRTFVDRVNATSYSGKPAGENIAAGQQTARAVVNAWLKSLPHCLNIMRRSFDDVGYGLAQRNDPRYSEPVTYWVQDFGYEN